MVGKAEGLNRALGLWLLVAYGLGITIGAGIYVLVGSVAQVAGEAAPLSFAVAGLAAALIGACYAELAIRFPEAGGTPVFVRQAFGSDRLSQFAGLAVGAVMVLSTASIARGSAGYIREFVDLPAPLVAAVVVALGTCVASLGVRHGVGFAATMTVIEVGGLLLVVAIGAGSAHTDWDRLPNLFAPTGTAGWSGVASGAFLAFFAFIGFENLANMAEEARTPERTLPRAVLLSLVLSTAIYVAVGSIAVLAIPTAALVDSEVPLLLVVRHATWFSPTLFAAIALIAVSNGVLLELMALGRLLYGMARRGWAPSALAAVNPGSQVPRAATFAGGALVMVFAVLLPFVSLAGLTSAVTLLVFALVAAALWRLQEIAPRTRGFRVPRAVPLFAIAASLLLVIGALLP
jgi:basic amino acid/polyamine antiporter, APA family